MGVIGQYFANPEFADSSRLNQKTLFVGTGTAINALSPTYSGQLVFCTSTGSGFSVDRVYQRNVANSAWIEVLDNSGTQTITGMTIDDNTNTLSLQNAAFSNSAFTTAKWANSLTKIVTTSTSSKLTTTSTSYVDVTDHSIGITATGNRSMLITKVVSNVDSTVPDDVTFAITDESNNIKGEFVEGCDNANDEESLVVIALESAPSAGSITRKLRWKVASGTGGYADEGVSGGNNNIMYLWEVL